MTRQEKSRTEIPLLDLKAQYETIGPELEKEVLRVIRSQQFILGAEVRRLEEDLAKYCGCLSAVGCASGSDALLLALMACGVGAGDEVITTPYSFFATAAAIVRLGAKPVFVDIEKSAFNIDVSRIEDAITERTRAIIPVHLFGRCANMERINEVASRYNVYVIEDAAQAIGSEHRGRRAGNLGHMACFSFYPSKNLGGAGDGGAITTNDADIADLVRILRSHGAKRKYYHEMVGINSRLDAMQAVILSLKLRYLDRWAEQRRSNAAVYRGLFNETRLVENAIVRLPEEDEDGLHVFNQFVVRVSDRDSLRQYLHESGIGTEIYYPLPLHLQSCFSELGYKEGSFPESELAARESLAIPVYPELESSALEYIVDSINSHYSKTRVR